MLPIAPRNSRRLMIASRDSGANIVTVQASELSVAACPPLGSGDGIVTAQTSALIGLELASPLQHEMLADDRDGSFASISAIHVCLSPDSDR